MATAFMLREGEEFLSVNWLEELKCPDRASEIRALQHLYARTIDPKIGKLVPQWHREGSHDAIAEQLFTRLKHQRLLLEYDSDRADGFEPLRFVPKNKIAVLGLVSTKSSDMETVNDLKRRIDQASRYLPLDQLALSPQCGFGGIDSKVLSEEEMWRKLNRIVETAAQVWRK
ncbi:MAG: hypothetical protein HYU46_23795 [Deltaproteobacteria bacterium]|nr:hypothetical protein [Deltaproteobacteria bacterium]